MGGGKRDKGGLSNDIQRSGRTNSKCVTREMRDEEIDQAQLFENDDDITGRSNPCDAVCPVARISIPPASHPVSQSISQHDNSSGNDGKQENVVGHRARSPYTMQSRVRVSH